jgi:ESCRT-II complex subunit VPS36
MGIANPVTRMSAGSMYHQELARQMAQFLKLGDQLGVRGGVMTLPDVFCLFNR